MISTFRNTTNIMVVYSARIGTCVYVDVSSCIECNKKYIPVPMNTIYN